jgi:hypothetical protein
MISFKNKYIIHEMNINVEVLEDEFNYSQNPTLQTGSSGDLKEFAKDNNFTPYITTIGLYNDSNELLAVAKLGRPLRKTDKSDTTFKIKFDI